MLTIGSVDPFGNYLCQKLLEYSTDEQRDQICRSVGKDLVNISLNMHGTRAVQKMIDFLSTSRQVSLTCSNTFLPPFFLAILRRLASGSPFDMGLTKALFYIFLVSANAFTLRVAKRNLPSGPLPSFRNRHFGHLPPLYPTVGTARNLCRLTSASKCRFTRLLSPLECM